MIEGSKLGYYLMPIIKIWLFMFFLLLCTVPFGLIAQLNFLPAITYPVLADIVVQSSLVLVVLGALLMMFKVLPDLNFHQVFIRRPEIFSGFLKGSGVGFGIISLCALLLYANGNVVFEKAGISLGDTFLYIVYFLLIAIFEEFLFRSYTLFALSERYPLWFAVFVNGLLFALAHFGNPGVTVLGIVNITLAGMLFAIYTLQKQNVSWALGVHFAWNFVQAIVLGYNVSGNQMPGFVKAIPQGETYFSGGKFGIEGSVCCTLFLLACIGWLIYKDGFGNVESKEFEVLEPED